MKVIGVNFHKNHNRQSLEKQAPLQLTNKDSKQISRNGMLPYLPDMDKMPYFIPVMTKFVPSFKGDYFENEYTKKVKNKQYQGLGLMENNELGMPEWYDFKKVGSDKILSEPLDWNSAIPRDYYVIFAANALPKPTRQAG